MADNLDVTPPKRYNEYAQREPQTYAKALVQEYINRVWDRTTEREPYYIFVVWYSFTLGNWKCLISTTLPDGAYYEVTHNKEENETYIDKYVKVDNVCIPD